MDFLIVAEMLGKTGLNVMTKGIFNYSSVCMIACL